MDEHTTPQDSANESLTPAQAADVINYYNAGENERSRQRGWKDKVALGQSAVHTTSPLQEHTILPDGKPTLTKHEMGLGLDYIQNPPKSDAYYARVDELVDKRSIPYDEAMKQADAEGLK